MNKEYILVGLLIVIFVVSAGVNFYMLSTVQRLSADYSALSSNYSTLYTDYDNALALYNNLTKEYVSLGNSYMTLYADYTTLKGEYATLQAEYNNLTAKSAELSNQLSTVSGEMTAYGILSDMASTNIPAIDQYLIGPYHSNFSITSPPGNGTVTVVNSSQLKQVNELLGQFFGFPEVRLFVFATVVNFPTNNTLQVQAVVKFGNTLANGSLETIYSIVNMEAQEYSLGHWQVIMLSIDDSLNQDTYHMVTTSFDFLNALVTESGSTLETDLIGPFPSYVYISAGPFAGNYSGSTAIISGFLGKVIPSIKSMTFTTYNFTFSPISSSQGTLTFYGDFTMVLTNGTVLNYPNAELMINLELEPVGIFQITGVNILI